MKAKEWFLDYFEKLSPAKQGAIIGDHFFYQGRPCNKCPSKIREFCQDRREFFDYEPSCEDDWEFFLEDNEIEVDQPLQLEFKFSQPDEKEKQVQ